MEAGEATEGEVPLRPIAIGGRLRAARTQETLSREESAVLLVDSAMRVRMATRNLDGGDGQTLLDLPLPQALDAVNDVARIELAVRHAIAGDEEELRLETPVGTRTARFLPAEGKLEGGAAAMVLVERVRGREPKPEVDELRARVGTLDSLTGASRALARSTDAAGARGTICEAALEVAGCELAAVIEPAREGGSLVVTTSSGAELGGRTLALEHSGLATRAFTTGEPAFCADLARQGGDATWPLTDAGMASAIWQPVRRAAGVRGLIAVGWRERRPQAGSELTNALGLLADEAGVAIDRAAAIEHLTEMARTDPLTDLSNRRAWEDELSRELSRAARLGEPLSIGLIDLDDLKSFNDRWGHAAGDRLLLTAGARWRRRLRLTDLIARIGGDEFAITLPGCRLPQAVELGDQLRAALPDGLSCSIGVAEWVPGESAAALLGRADEALYAAKDAGRDATFALSAPVEGQTGRSVPSS